MEGDGENPTFICEKIHEKMNHFALLFTDMLLLLRQTMGI